MGELKSDTTLRGVLAVSIVAIFLVTLIGGFVGAMSNDESDWENTKQLLEVVVPIETALLGAIGGYFFGKTQ